MIGTVRRISDQFLLKLNRPLPQDSLATFLCEAANAVISRPLGNVSADANDPLALSPITLLTMKSLTFPCEH